MRLVRLRSHTRMTDGIFFPLVPSPGRSVPNGMSGFLVEEPFRWERLILPTSSRPRLKCLSVIGSAACLAQGSPSMAGRPGTRYNYPRFDYTWNYVRSSAEIVLDVTSVLAGWREGRLVSVNLFAGGGTAVGFRNIEANRARRNNPDFQGLEKLWAGTRFFWAARGGLELDLRLARRLSICLESDAGIFPDEFNSKVGKDSGFDWQFNCLVGLKFDLGR